MKVLGISDGMTGGAALMEDGQIRYAIHEERLIRAKMATGFPQAAINHVLEATGLKPSEIDAIAIATLNEVFREEPLAYDGWLREEQAPLKELMLGVSSSVNQIFGGNELLKNAYYGLKSITGKPRRQLIVERLRTDWDFTCPIEFIEHHFAHSCCAYFTSGLQEATVITLDGAGDNTSSRVYSVKNGRFRKLHNIDSFNSIGNYYAYITHLCGFKAQKHEGKIAGLAAHGQPLYADLLKEFIAYDTTTIVNRGQVFYWSAVKALQKSLPNNFRKTDLAASMQHVLEEVGSSYISHWVDRSGCSDLTLAGGVFANVKFNQVIHELENVNSIFIHPGMGDEGLGVGAALGYMATHGSMPEPPVRLTDVYFGPSYNNTEIERAIVQAGIEGEYCDRIERRVAELLAEGYVVARFNGPMEYGPRALGNRTILYQTTDPSVNTWLNQRLNRTEFMPFAPVTLAEYAEQCYKNLDGARYPAQFMTITFNCTDWMQQNCPAVVHIDGTARPQLLDESTNPSYYKILQEYYNLTGLPCLINTSFNMHEEPIVCTPDDAVRGFLKGNLDYLAAGNYLLKHPQIDSFQRSSENEIFPVV
jgi:carbamoyltransferase